MEAERNTETKKRYLTIEDEVRKIEQRRDELHEETASINTKLPILHRDHFECVRDEVLKLMYAAPDAAQVLVDMSLLQEVHRYFKEYEYGNTLPQRPLPF